MASQTNAERLDHPDNINAFLNMIGGTKVTHASINPKTNVNQQKDSSIKWDANYNNQGDAEIQATTDLHDTNSEEKEGSGHDTPGAGGQAASIASSPATAGLRAPPPTPVTRALNTESSPTLPSVEEDHTQVLHQLAEESDLTLEDSKFARGTGRRPVSSFSTGFNSPRPMSNYNFNSNMAPRTKMANTQKELLTRMAEMQEKSLEDSVISRFRAQNAHLYNSSKQKENQPPKPEVRDTAVDDNMDDQKPIKTRDTIPFPAFQDAEPEKIIADNPAEVKTESPMKFLQETGEFNPTTPPANTATMGNPSEEDPLPQDEGEGNIALDTAKSQLANQIASLSSSSQEGSPSIVVTCSTDSEADVEEEEEDRENQKHFKSWGTPPARDRPRARIRKVILTGLPTGSDLTLVQSLVSGGAIDSCSVSPMGNTAYVTFTSGEACDSFYNKYPNGITFRLKGKDHTVFVDKAKDVDIISGMLQGYLDCGASRCVRAVGADEDWGMGALYKLAYGKSRKVEHIIDTYRSNIRTIIFRFASIGDAVQFKTVLVRDEDWEACNIQFMDDPCEKASSVHLE